MNFDDFINGYQSLLMLQKIDFPLPVVVNGASRNVVLRLGFSERNPNKEVIASWKKIVNYQLIQLKLYLQQNWRVMMDKDEKKVSHFLSFLQMNQEVFLFMEKELFFFLAEVDKRLELFSLTECFLQNVFVEDYLARYADDAEMQQIFQDIMVLKIQHFQDSMAFFTNYRIFIEWMPKWKNSYPNVWNAIVQKLLEMKNGVNLNVSEAQMLYKLYGLV